MDKPLKGLSTQIATTILTGFDRHFTIFSDITQGARERFENADWEAERTASRERILYYDIRVRDSIGDLQKLFDLEPFDSQLWFDVKREYVLLISNHLQPELAETFYNSVFCALFHRDYFGNDYIFVRSAVSTEHIDSIKPSYHVYYPAKRGFRLSIKQVLLDSGFNLPFENIDRDVRNIIHALIKYTFTRPRRAHLNFSFRSLAACSIATRLPTLSAGQLIRIRTFHLLSRYFTAEKDQFTPMQLSLAPRDLIDCSNFPMSTLWSITRYLHPS